MQSGENRSTTCLGKEKRRGLDRPISTIIPQPLSDLPSSLSNLPAWFHVTGHLVGNQVLIRRSGDIALLLNMGVFGTRLFSSFASEMTEKRRCGDESSEDSSDDEDEDPEDVVPSKRQRLNNPSPPPPPLISPPAALNSDSEALVLSSYEAFFLAHSVGMLQVFSKNNYGEKPLSLLNLWEIFTRQSSVFPYHYAVYLYYRGKGWVPKHGLRVGAHFTLYPIGPPFFHAAFSVRIHIVRSDSLSTGRSLLEYKSSLTAKDLMTSSRVTNKVNKKLVICYVVVPEILAVDTPKMIQQLKVKEVLVERFHPERLTVT